MKKYTTSKTVSYSTSENFVKNEDIQIDGQHPMDFVNNILKNIDMDNATIRRSFKKTVVKIDENGNKTIIETTGGDNDFPTLSNTKKKCLYCGNVYNGNILECNACGSRKFEDIEE